MQTSLSLAHELGRRGRRPLRRGVDLDGSDTHRALTFTSSLSIPAPGSLSLPKTTPLPTPRRTPEPAPSNPSTDLSQPPKRAPRKSKIDAIAAMSRAASPPTSTLTPSTPSEAPKLPSVLRPVPNAEPLDLSSISTTPTPHTSTTSDPPRLFGLQEVPTYYPSPEEFTDPMAYISSIAPQAEKFGGCKIVPPKNWKMPFVTNTKTFRFMTRVQRLNAIEASSRAKLNFLEQLYRFHDQSLNRPTIPTIAHKPVDLWVLRKEVHKRDGFEAVRDKYLDNCLTGLFGSWGDIGRAMGYDNMIGVSTQLKNAYSRIIQPFDNFVAQVRGTAANNPNLAHIKYPTRSAASSHSGQSPSAPGNGMRSSGSGASTSSSARAPNSSASNSSIKLSNGHSQSNGSLAASSSTLANGLNVDATTGISSSRASPTEDSIDGKDPKEDTQDMKPTPIPPSTPIKSPSPPTNGSLTPGTIRLNSYALPALDDVLKGENCEICRAGTDDLNMLLCDGCDRGFHTYCLTPAMTIIPKGQWYCNACLFDSDYGFDEGEDHSLSSFQKRAANFRKMWFDSHPPQNALTLPNGSSLPPSGPRSSRKPNGGKVAVSEDDVEKEFWRLVESPYDSVEVEYGADIHSTTHGSASPTLERQPQDPYSRDPWNLNNMPILQDSLLRYIKSDISGMTVPWTYVGMVFSAFCWHNEDHYTCSVNFMHWGETKTWYTIPGADAAKFEAAIKSEAPELFETQPDLLFQLVTMMNPGRLKAAGVRVYGCNQRAGEFVITFPQAYHSGFNHGFNFNEAVNFALPEWLPFDLSCIRRYQEHQKPPVFSHDELLMTITQFSPTVSTATWLLDSLAEMKEREIVDRQQIRTSSMFYEEVNYPKDHTEESQYQCSVCKVFCYLSQVKCTCTESVACLEHYDSLCVCEDHTSRKFTLRTRFTDKQILDIYEEVAGRHGLPLSWQQQLRDILADNPRPLLKSLRGLLVDADEVGAPVDEVKNLEEFINHADEWTVKAQVYLTRKVPVRKRGRKSRAAAPLVESDPLPEQEYSLQDAQALISEVENVGFDNTERVNLTNSVRQIQQLRTQVLHFLELSVEHRELESGEVLLSDCRAALFSFPEASELDEAVQFLNLLNELDNVDDSSLTLDYVEELLERAENNKMSPDHEYFVELVAKRDAGRTWKGRADNALKGKGQTIADLWDIINPEAGTPTIDKTRNALQAAWTKAKEMEKTAKAIMSTHRDKRSTPEEALALVNRASDFDIPVMTELSVLARRGVKFSTIYRSIIAGTYQGDDDHSLSRLFIDLMAWRKEIRGELWMLNIPEFFEVDEQLTQHQNWLETLPWSEKGQFPAVSNKPFGKAFHVLQDVIYETRSFDQDMPGADCSCICTKPVEVKHNGQAAVQCDSCGAKFHEKCISGSCPFCDHHHWDGKIQKNRGYSLQDLQMIYNCAPDLSRGYSAFAKLLSAIISSCHSFSKHIDAFMKTLKPNAHTVPPGVVAKIRHIMRKLYVIQFRWPQNGNASTTYGAELAVLHRTLAAKPVGHDAEKHRPYPMHVGGWNLGKPKITFRCELFASGADGCRCVCEGQAQPAGPKKYLSCKECHRVYHHQCVADLHRPVNEPQWKCPVCVGKQGQVYPDRQLRVKDPADTDPNIFVDYVNWILRRGPCQKIRLPDPRPNEPVIVLRIAKWVFAPADPPPPLPASLQTASKKKPGRPPTKRFSDLHHNGAPTPIPGHQYFPRPTPYTISASNTPGSGSPVSSSASPSLGSAPLDGKDSSSTLDHPRTASSFSADNQPYYRNYLPTQIPLRPPNPPPSIPSLVATSATLPTLAPTPTSSIVLPPKPPLVSGAPPRVIPPPSIATPTPAELEARKRRMSDADLLQPPPKAPKTSDDRSAPGGSPRRTITPPPPQQAKPVVVTPRIEALLSPSLPATAKAVVPNGTS